MNCRLARRFGGPRKDRRRRIVLNLGEEKKNSHFKPNRLSYALLRAPHSRAAVLRFAAAAGLLRASKQAAARESPVRFRCESAARFAGQQANWPASGCCNSNERAGPHARRQAQDAGAPFARVAPTEAHSTGGAVARGVGLARPERPAGRSASEAKQARAPTASHAAAWARAPDCKPRQPTGQPTPALLFQRNHMLLARPGAKGTTCCSYRALESLANHNLVERSRRTTAWRGQCASLRRLISAAKCRCTSTMERCNPHAAYLIYSGAWQQVALQPPCSCSNCWPRFWRRAQPSSWTQAGRGASLAITDGRVRNFAKILVQLFAFIEW